MLYYSILYGSMALSWLGYSMYIAYKGSTRKEPVDSNVREVPSIAVIFLFTLAFNS